MANKAKAKSKTKKKNTKNNNLMMWVFVALFLLIVIAIAVILTLNKSNPNTDERFFISDGTKYVVESDTLSVNSKDGPVAAYDIYYYSGDKITEHKAYYEFPNAETAEKALPTYQEMKDDDISAIELDGRFIVLTAAPAQYQDVTVEMVRQWAGDDDDKVEGYDEDGEIDDGMVDAGANIDVTENVDEAEFEVESVEEVSN